MNIISEDDETTPAIELVVRRSKDTVIGCWYDVLLYDFDGEELGVARCAGCGHVVSEEEFEFRDPADLE